MPLAFAPLEAYQFDWSHACVVIVVTPSMQHRQECTHSSAEAALLELIGFSGATVR